MIGRWKPALSAALIVGAGSAVIAASAPGWQRIEKAADIVPAMSTTQQASDQLPAKAAKTFAPTGIDLGSTRFLGRGKNLEYYAAPLGSDRICIVTVGSGGIGKMMGCTLLKGFEEYGLRVANPDKSEEAWLLVPNCMQVAVSKDASVKWAEKANNFLVKEPAGT